MKQFDFLRTIKILEETPGPKATVKTPDVFGLRIFTNGKVYPSKELVEKFSMAYDAENSNGMDIFLSTEWSQYPEGTPPVLLVAFVPRTEGKITLFGSLPKGSKPVNILSHGPKSPELLELIRTTYKLTDEELYIDVVVDATVPLTTSNNIYFIPKVVQRGEKKGEKTYVRRENITIYPLLPKGEETTQEATTEVEQIDHLSDLNSIPQ